MTCLTSSVRVLAAVHAITSFGCYVTHIRMRHLAADRAAVTFRASNSFLPAIETQYSTREVYAAEPVIDSVCSNIFSDSIGSGQSGCA